MARSSLRFTLASTLLPLLLLTMAGLSRASTLTVTSLLDTGPGTLRNAIDIANVVPFASATIKFSVSGTITLGSPLPGIGNTSKGGLTIDGSGQTITISGANAVQILSVNTGARLSLQNLTIANGRITSAAEAGGVTNFGILTINNCTLSGNNGFGGGILNLGPMTVTNSTFANNGAVNGGAINNNQGGIATVINSTFSGNHGLEAAPVGIENLKQMAAVKGAPLIVTNGAAIALGAAIINFDQITVTNCTFSRNQGSIASTTAPPFVNGGAINNEDGTFSLKSSILADSTGGNCEGEVPFTDAGYNISDDATCPTTSGTSVDSSTTLNLSPAGLVNNGGPTDTIALEPNSQAVDFIPVADCTDQSSPTPLPVTTDQRGEPRPDPGNPNFCDAGAYELQTSYDFALLSDRVQIARSGAANADQVNMGLTFTDLPNPTCGSDDDVLNNGLTVELFAGSCTDLMGTGLSVDLDPFVVHTINHESYGTYFLSSPPETVSARMVAVPPPDGTCGEWMLNLEVTGLDTPALGLGGTNPFALILQSTDLHVFGCFDINNAITGNQIVTPTKTVRRGVRR